MLIVFFADKEQQHINRPTRREKKKPERPIKPLYYFYILFREEKFHQVASRLCCCYFHVSNCNQRIKITEYTNHCEQRIFFSIFLIDRRQYKKKRKLCRSKLLTQSNVQNAIKVYMQLRKYQQPAKNFTRCVSNAVYKHRERKPSSLHNYHVNFSFIFFYSLDIHFKCMFLLYSIIHLISLFRCHFQYKLFVAQNVISLCIMLKKQQQQEKNGIKHVLNVVRCPSNAIPFSTGCDLFIDYLLLMQLFLFFEQQVCVKRCWNQQQLLNMKAIYFVNNVMLENL